MRGIRAFLSALFATGLLVASAPSIAGAAQKSYTYSFSGTTKSDNAQVDHTVTCPSGSYVASAGKNQGTVFDDPYLDTSGTDSGVDIANSPTESVDWGHPESQLATEITLGVGNNPDDSGKSLDFSITTKCTTNKTDAWVVLSTAPVPNSLSDSSDTFSGTTEGNKIYRKNVNCAPGYVKNNGVNTGTVWDHPYFDTTGTDNSEVYTDYKASGSVEWGHFGSRLANSILVGAGYPGFTENSYHYSITTMCTSNQNDAWVILFVK